MKMLDYAELTIHIRSKVYDLIKNAVIEGVDDFVRDDIHSDAFDLIVDTLDHIHSAQLTIAADGMRFGRKMLFPSL
jgi:hypothetical protein